MSNREKAFPGREWQQQGMDLRDYFAAKAIQGMLAVPDDQRYGDRADQSLSIDEWQAWCVTGMVEHAYRVADAMIAQRGKGGRP